MKIQNHYPERIVVKSDSGRFSLFHCDDKIKDVVIPNCNVVTIGKPIFEDNRNYTIQQYSTTQGLPALNIINHYDVPILINDLIVDPHCQIRYTGVYHNGIPYGEILRSSFDEDVVIVNSATDLHYGLIVAT